VKLLKKAGAGINTQENSGKTALASILLGA